MSANDYAEKVVLEFMKNITDHVFLSIQHDDDALRAYQTQVNRHGLQTVNAAIGLKVKTMFKLDNDGVCDSPKSALIDGFTYHTP